MSAAAPWWSMRVLRIGGPSFLLGLWCCHPSGGSRGASASARPSATLATEPLVAEAALGNMRGNYMYFLPITLHGHRVSLILDTGTSVFPLALFTERLAAVGMAVPSQQPKQRVSMDIDSLRVGTSTVRHIVATVFKGHPLGREDLTPPGFPPLVGVIGQRLLSHYDLLFDGPAQRVRLYQYAPPAQNATQPSALAGASLPRGGLPAGITPDACTPMITGKSDVPPQPIAMVIKGQAVETWFDSGFSYGDSTDGYGSGGAQFNDTTAKLLGVSSTMPTVRHDHLEPGDGFIADVPVMIGARRLILPFAHMTRAYDAEYEGQPFLQIGLLPFRNRLLLLSYSSSRFCVSASGQTS